MSSKLEHEARKLVGKNYGKGSGTKSKLLGNIKRIADFMADQGLQSIQHLKTKHVERFFESLLTKERTPSTLSGYATAMRTIAGAIGKPNIVPRSNTELGFDRSCHDRYRPKQGALEKMLEVRSKLYAKAEWQGLAYDMAREFSLREKESLLSNQIAVRAGREYLIVEGAKGGRPRDVPIERDEQRALLDRVKEHIRDTGGKSLIPPSLSLPQALKKQSNDMYRAGGTKENQANGHLWRHVGAQAMSREGKSDQDISNVLGHGREGAAKHYK